MLSNTINL